MYTVTGQSIQEYRKSSYKCLTFTGCHFSNFSLMQDNTTEQLDVVMNHIPSYFITACHPMIFPICLVSVNTDKILSLSSQFTVHIGSSHLYFFIFRPAASRVLYYSKCSGKHLIQCFFILIENFFFKLVNLAENRLTLFYINGFDAGFQFLDLLVFFCGRIFDIFLQFFSLGAQFVITQFGNFRIDFLHLIYPRLNFFHIAGSLVPEKFADKFVKSHCILLFLLFQNYIFRKFVHKDNQFADYLRYIIILFYLQILLKGVEEAALGARIRMK